MLWQIYCYLDIAFFYIKNKRNINSFMKAKHKAEKEKLKEDIQQEEVVQETILEEQETNSDDTDELTEDISADLQQKCEELNDKNLRLMAEFDNYRKRTLKEKADLIKHAGERIFVDMLPLVDDFERALQAMDSTDNADAVKEGVELIYKKFIGFLNANGVQVIPTENEVFDVDVHEAVTTFPAPSEEMKGKIIDCTSKGYTLHDKVIRFAKVVVGE